MTQTSAGRRPGPLVLAILLALPSGCTGVFDAYLHAGAYAPSVRGEAMLSDATVSTPVGDVNLRNDLELDERDVVPYVRAGVGLVGLRLSGSGFRTEQKGTGTLSANFGNINAGTVVDTELDLGVAHGALTLDFFDLEFARLGIGVGADYFDVDLHAESTLLPTLTTADLNVQQAVPLAVAQAEVKIPVIDLRGAVEVSGIAGRYGEIEGALFDVDAIVSMEPVDFVEIFAGYRWLRFEIDGTMDGQRFDGNIVLSGFFAGLGVRF